MNRSAPLAIVLVVVASALAASSPPAAAATTYEVTGRVVSDAGIPLEGAVVYGHSRSDDGIGGEDKATTDADGRYSLRLTEGRGYVSVRYDAWRTGEGREIVVDGNVSGVDVVLRTPPPKTAVLEGRILDAAGNPIEGARVSVQQRCCYAYEDQAAPMPAPVPPTPTAASDAEATGEGGGSTGSAGNETGATTASSAPASEPRPAIAPCCCCYDDGQSVVTGADGRYRFETYPGPRQITAAAPGYAYTTVEVDAEANATLTRDVVLVKVPAADAVLKGRVLDAKTGLPVANAQVSLSNAEWSRHASATTGPDGSYTLTSLPGWSQLTVHVYAWMTDAKPLPADADVAAVSSLTVAPGSSGYYQYLHSLRVASGETTHDIELEPKPAPEVVLQGYVVDPDTKTGIRDATVNVWNQDTGDWGSATTDATGSWRMLVRPGHYTATSYAPGHLQGGAAFVIAEDEKLKRVDLFSPAGESRWAPCDDCYAREAYAESASMDDGDSGTAPPMAAPTPALAGGPSADRAASSALASGADGRSGGTAYMGTGGGLPPYQEADAATDGGDAQTPAKTSDGSGQVETTSDGEGLPAAQRDEVPAPGAFALVAALGLAAVVLLARRK